MKKFNSINDITMESIVAFVKDSGAQDIVWLKELASKTKVDKNGKERRISFIEIRREFALKYFPELTQKKEQKKTMYDLIAEL